MKMTITEALAEIKTLIKRINKKQTFIQSNLLRDSCFQDDLEKNGGSPKVIVEERQSIKDLENRIIALRSAISKKNQSTELTIVEQSKTIADWLIWRRDVMPNYQQFLNNMTNQVARAKQQASNNVRHKVDTDGRQSSEQVGITVHIDEKKLAEEIEQLEEILGSLDGQLSLLNATTMIEI